ncbi:MAG: bifunctional riboflavin kinase/FAD synthetase [Tissierellia bacterium]|nr:bifunctional riboflavin kinase/FAD synthetase [Tissierellia bacterium]
MKVIDLDKNELVSEQSYITLGNFDGIHIAHQALLKKVVTEAKNNNTKSSVLLFKNNFKTDFNHTRNNTLMNTDQKVAIMEDFGIDIVYLVKFDEYFMNTPSDEFIQSFLMDRLKVKGIIIGYDYRYGKGAEGNTDSLKSFASTNDLNLFIIDPVYDNGQLVSSSLIKKMISSGDFKNANELLTREYTILGKVVPGKHLGSKHGFPTANLDILCDYVLPATGVYLTRVTVDGQEKYGVTSVGQNITFNEKTFKIETHIMDFNEDIYGMTIKIGFITKLREMVKFDSIEELKEQVFNDIDDAKSLIEMK